MCKRPGLKTPGAPCSPLAILKINMATPHEAVPEENINFQGETENEMEILYADNTETASNVIELTSNVVLSHEEDEDQGRVEIPRTPTSEIITTTRGRSTHVRTPSKKTTSGQTFSRKRKREQYTSSDSSTENSSSSSSSSSRSSSSGSCCSSSSSPPTGKKLNKKQKRKHSARKPKRFNVVSKKAKHKWKLSSTLASHGNKNACKYQPEKDIFDNILNKNPVPTNIKEPPKLDEFMISSLRESKKTYEETRDKEMCMGLCQGSWNGLRTSETQTSLIDTSM